MYENLKVCPFCGSNEIEGHKFEFGIKLHCVQCGCYGPTYINSSSNSWNTRHSPWISVEEKLPYENGYYLVSRDLSKHKAKIKVTIRQFHEHTKGSRKRFWHSGGEDMSITHWMPLPTPP